jgi:hypothetical protein
MLVKALHKGIPGTEILFEQNMEAQLGKDCKLVGHNGYIPHPGGLYEIPQSMYLDPSFLRENIPANSIIKIPYDGLPALPCGNWTVVFISRDPEEIQASSDALQTYVQEQGASTGFTNESIYKAADERLWPFDVFTPYNQADIDHVMCICEMRRDIRLFDIDYNVIMDRPEVAFAELKEQGLTELNIDAAASVVNPELYRSRHAANP